MRARCGKQLMYALIQLLVVTNIDWRVEDRGKGEQADGSAESELFSRGVDGWGMAVRGAGRRFHGSPPSGEGLLNRIRLRREQPN